MSNSFGFYIIEGYNLEHNFVHGKKNISKTLCSLNILAFLFHTVQELKDELSNAMFNFKSFNAMIEFILEW